MYDVLTTLSFVAFILLIWVLISPKSLTKYSKKEITRRKTAPLFIVIILVLGILVIFTAPAQKSNNQPVQLTTKSTTTTTEKTVTQTKSIPYTSTTVQDSNLVQGTSQITTTGVNGEEILTYMDMYTNGKLTSQKLVSAVITTQPVTQVTSVGTYVAPTPTTTPSTASCYPLTNGGNCYEPGEYCRTSDYGVSGVAGDGEAITCEDNNGWRWEPN
jgi:cytoskeletal protein RodZ